MANDAQSSLDRVQIDAGGAGDPVLPRSGAADVLAGIQYLRALAAVAVVVFHAALPAGLHFWVGEAGVDLFFLLSGFLMAVITTADTRPIDFLRNRARRIVPLYWIATSAMLLLALAGLAPRMRLEAWHVLSSYLFVPSRSPMSGEVFPLLVPGWTLNFEMFFYAGFAVALWVAARRRVALLCVVLVGAVVAGQCFEPSGAIAVTYTSPMLLEFVVGMMIGQWWTQGRAAPAVLGRASLVLAALLFAMVWSLDTDRMRVLLFGIPAALLFVSVLAIEQRKRIGKVALPLLLGNASYSIYLWHTLAISVVARVAGAIGLPRLAILPLGVVAGLVAGVASYLLIEKPLLKRPGRARGTAMPRAALAAAR